ncbi:riboflavin biosynthesis protein RibD [Striga asiatica]|uniref:Riboflavin biosynthesis protein RibD n=1 Tax=Striga asiatica TaxID=4170 RepID=A0A5A7PS11_STRAF|nr:riboflavin biosynthesis protein RibD [Striga asiatica]
MYPMMEASDIGKVVAGQGEVFRWPQGARFKVAHPLFISLESCVKHTSTVPPLSTAVVRLEILRLLSPEVTAVGKGCGRDGSTAVEIERQSPEKGCGRHTFSDGRCRASGGGRVHCVFRQKVMRPRWSDGCRDGTTFAGK